MGSLRFSFMNFNLEGKHKVSSISKSTTNSRPLATSVAFAVAAGAAALAGIATTAAKANPIDKDAKANGNLFSLPWCSISLAEGGCGSTAAEPKTGMVFPTVIGGSRNLLGIGLRKKSILGLKNIDVYAFGVYADKDDLKKTLKEKYGKLSASELNEHKSFDADLLEGDISMTVRLQIVYGKLSIRSVRSAFEESVGSRLQKFGGTANPELLGRFTSQFKDEYKIPRGSVIELSKERGYVLRTTIDGNEVGRIQSKLLCRSILDLYLGEEPFDKNAREEIKSKVGCVLHE